LIWAAQKGGPVTVSTKYPEIEDEDELKAWLAGNIKNGCTPTINHVGNGPRWCEDDREWFEKNYRRTHRLRFPFAGEQDSLTDPEKRDWPNDTPDDIGPIFELILVQQVAPRRRIRLSIWMAEHLFPLFKDEDNALFTICERIKSLKDDLKSGQGGELR
jgi:hypothetical protein